MSNAGRNEFSESTLTELLHALEVRSSTHPANPGLVASWPGVRAAQMAAACTELHRRGYPLFRVAVTSQNSPKTREGWALRGSTDAPVGSA